jgi:organic hydroperoxide reductase OsmC/OhrA
MAGGDEPAAASPQKSQAEGASESSREPAVSSAERHRFSASVDWAGGGDGCGTAKLTQGSVTFPVGGATALGGCGIGANPEELLDAAIGACFVETWAIFLKKLNLSYGNPSVRVSSRVGPDPAGGFRLAEATVHARVPAALLAAHRPAVEKTLALAEKYCILSRAVRGSVPMKVEIEEV